MKKLIYSMLIIISFNSNAGQPFLTVGNGGTCDASSIQEAIDSNLSDTIRIASNKVYSENVTIDDRDIVLSGGYADCPAAENNITDLSKAVVDGQGSGNVISIIGNGSILEITIRNLSLTNGSSGLTSLTNTELTIEDVTMSNNANVGVFVFGAANNVNLADVIISSNQGSGIVCIGENNVIGIGGNSLITMNETTNTGGGMSISGGCRVNAFAPLKITDNNADGHGGGVLVSNGSIVNLNGVEINNNSADFDGDDSGDGGGLYVEGELSIVNAINTKFEGNFASKGGAVAVAEEGRFTSYATNTMSNPCVTPGECTSFTGNTVTSFGGVFYASNQGRILALHALIRGNGAPADGLVAFANGGGHIEIEGSFIVKNGGEDLPADDLFHIAGLLDNSTRITLDHVTVADNELTESVVRNSFGNFSLTSSIVQEEVDVSSATNEVSHTFECAIVNETDSFSSGGTVTINDPQFINTGAGNYHIKPTSPAIDYCYAAATLIVELGYDIDLEGRDYDDPNVTDLHGTFDIGADEYRWDNDLIFMNDFEQE